MNKDLIRKAAILFPRRDYTDPQAVRHARRQWLRSVEMLRCAPGGSRWVLDGRVERKAVPQ